MARQRRPALDGRELSDAELTVIRQHLEKTDTISGISDDMRNLIAQFWPDQLVKLKPPKAAGGEVQRLATRT